MRSMLFVPADSARKMAKGRDCGADALILDLEDSVGASQRPTARRLACDFLQATTDRTQRLMVRINPLAGEDALKDLAAVMPGRPDSILLPKATPADLRRLDDFLSALEAANDIPRFTTRILAIATETAAGVFELGNYRGITQRLEALTWGAEDLAALLGAVNRLPDGRYDDTFRLARALCVLAAQAAGVDPIDTVYVDFKDNAGMRAECDAARRSGFTGKMAIHPGQVADINAAFSPDETELAWAREVIQYFEDHPDSGTVGIGGKMVDRPHVVLAERILARAGTKR